MATIDENWNIVDVTRAFCQKVLPLVYDESLSYMEMVCKMSSKLNEVIENNNNLPDYINEIIYNTLEEAIRNRGLKSSPFLNVLDYGLKNDGVTDNSPLFELIKEKEATIVFPPGTYYFSEPIVITKDGTRLLSFGNMEFSGNGIEIYSLDNVIFLYNIMCKTENNLSEGIKIAAITKPIGNMQITAPHIEKFSIGLHLYATGNNGVQNCEFRLNRIGSFSRYGILLECGNEGTPWVNENSFYDGWLFSTLTNASATAIKFKKGNTQTDKFNRNDFHEFSFEGTPYAINLEYATFNNFMNFRIIENAQENFIYLDSACENNNFYTKGAIIQYSWITDKGNNNTYEIIILKETELLANGAKSRQGFLLYDTVGISPTKKEVTNGYAQSDFEYITFFDIKTANIPQVIILNPKQTILGESYPFIVLTNDVSNGVQIQLYSGKYIASSIEGQAKYKLKSNTYYLFIPNDEDNFVCIPLSTTN